LAQRTPPGDDFRIVGVVEPLLLHAAEAAGLVVDVVAVDLRLVGGTERVRVHEGKVRDVEEGVRQRPGRAGRALRCEPPGDEPAVAGLGQLQRHVHRLGRRQPDQPESLADAERGRIGRHVRPVPAEHPGAAQQADLQPAARPQFPGQRHRMPGVLQRRIEIAEHRACRPRGDGRRLGSGAGRGLRRARRRRPVRGEPDPSVPLLHRPRHRQVGPRRRCADRPHRRDVDAAALAVEPPAVVRALQPALDDRPGRQGDEAVRATGRERAHLAARPQPHHDVRPPAGAHRPGRRPHLGAARHREPARRSLTCSHEQVHRRRIPGVLRRSSDRENRAPAVIGRANS
jgi:hypothetical protein